mmetsp:Transcript_88611/g.211575  ORF Transcript_88611/g.211575 Transcript_88611/m.211575 type:complete len:247 (-) Transcript_88611:1124-1864(-)
MHPCAAQARPGVSARPFGSLFRWSCAFDPWSAQLPNQAPGVWSSGMGSTGSAINLRVRSWNVESSRSTSVSMARRQTKSSLTRLQRSWFRPRWLARTPPSSPTARPAPARPTQCLAPPTSPAFCPWLWRRSSASETTVCKSSASKQSSPTLRSSTRRSSTYWHTARARPRRLFQSRRMQAGASMCRACGKRLFAVPRTCCGSLHGVRSAGVMHGPDGTTTVAAPMPSSAFASRVQARHGRLPGARS